LIPRGDSRSGPGVSWQPLLTAAFSMLGLGIEHWLQRTVGSVSRHRELTASSS
jgi:hypothetical protein